MRKVFYGYLIITATVLLFMVALYIIGEGIEHFLPTYPP